MKAVYVLLAACSVFAAACTTPGGKEQTPTQGEVSIVVDESLQPIIDDQLNVFNSGYPDAHVTMIYKPEVAALNLFLSDGVKVAVLSRKLNAQEMKHFQNRKIVVRANRFAIDGVALINNRSSSDTSVLVSDLVNILSGKPGKIRELVFDNANSSTFRYLKDLVGVSNLPAKGVYALKSNEEVISYTVDHPGSVGVVGMNWIEQPDVKQEALVGKLQYMSVKDDRGNKPGAQYYQPNQTTLALNQYPLMRELFIINCSGSHGVGTGFASFISGERGQRLVLKSGLLPDKIPTRQILIKK